MNPESAGQRGRSDAPGDRPRAFRRRRRTTDGPAFTRPDQYLGQNLYPLRAAFADPAAAADAHQFGAASGAPPGAPSPGPPAAATPFERLSSIEGLAGAWQMVLVRDARDGLLQRQTRLIAGDLDRFLAELSASLREGTYLPAPLLRADIPKRTPGQTRVLHIPTIRDRVVERAVVNTIAHDADRIMSPCSFAYRTGIGADDAVHHLATLRDDGYRHVLRTDVEDYFPNLDVEDALTVLAPVVGCPRTIDLIRLIARPRRARGERRTRSRGIAQGSCLSPLLANLVLNDADHALNDAGYGYARFADDIVVCAPARDDLLAARELLGSLVAAHGLNLNEEKTAMTTFDEGFCFLGVDFSRTRPAVDPHHDIKGAPNPDEVVYVGRDGARVHVSKGRLIVSGADELPLVSIPRRAVSRIVLTGAVGLSAGARSWALRNDVDVIFLSRHGGYLGQLSAPRDTANARRLLTQAAFAADAAGTDELMGLEGAASNAYFDCLSRLVPEDVAFHGRSRRPPKDLANAAFSYAYAILLAECTGALLAAGLEPSLGVLHASTDKRPSLSLDLMEEFRPCSWTAPSWRCSARGTCGPSTPPSPATAKGCGWTKTARRRSSTATRPRSSARSRAPCRVSPAPGGATYTTRPNCSAGPLSSPTTGGAARHGADRRSRLRHCRRLPAHPARRRPGGLGVPDTGVRFQSAAGGRRAGAGAHVRRRDHRRRRRRRPHLSAVRRLPGARRGPRHRPRPRRRRPVPRGVVKGGAGA